MSETPQSEERIRFIIPPHDRWAECVLDDRQKTRLPVPWDRETEFPQLESAYKRQELLLRLAMHDGAPSDVAEKDLPVHHGIPWGYMLVDRLAATEKIEKALTAIETCLERNVPPLFYSGSREVLVGIRETLLPLVSFRAQAPSQE